MNTVHHHHHAIVMLTGRFYPVYGGAEQQCLRLSKQLINDTIPVIVLTQSLPGLPSFEIIQEVPVYRVGVPLSGLFGSLCYTIAGLFWLLRNTSRYTIIHAHMASSTAILAAIASFLTRKPAIVKFAGSRLTGDIATSVKTWYGRLKLKYIAHMITVYVCPSEEIKHELTAHGFNERLITVIPNGVDTHAYSKPTQTQVVMARKDIHTDRETYITVFCGRLEKGKGIEELITAWRLCHFIRARLYVVGGGSQESTYRAFAANDPDIMFVGWTENVHTYLQAADCFVLPSLGEGLPNALIEAMSCGIPCIGTSIGGITELIRHNETGLLVPPGDSNALAHALTVVRQDRVHAEHLGVAAREFVEQRLSISQTALRYEKLYSSMAPQ